MSRKTKSWRSACGCSLDSWQRMTLVIPRKDCLVDGPCDCLCHLLYDEAVEHRTMKGAPVHQRLNVDHPTFSTTRGWPL